MRAKRAVLVLAWLIVPFVLAGCVMVPEPRGENVSFVPLLSPVMLFGPEPYYVYEGYYYDCVDYSWYYSRSWSGHWRGLPRKLRYMPCIWLHGSSR